MELIEQDFLEAMFDDLLREEEEKESYYGPPDEMPSHHYPSKKSSSMQLPKVRLLLTYTCYYVIYGPLALSISQVGQI